MGVFVSEACSRHGVIDADIMRFAILTWQNTGKYRRVFLRHSSLLRHTSRMIDIIEYMHVSVGVYRIRSEVISGVIGHCKWVSLPVQTVQFYQLLQVPAQTPGFHRHSNTAIIISLPLEHIGTRHWITMLLK